MNARMAIAGMLLTAVGCGPSVEEATRPGILINDIDEGQAAGSAGPDFRNLAIQGMDGLGEPKVEPVPGFARSAISRNRYVYSGHREYHPRFPLVAGTFGEEPVLSLEDDHLAQLARGSGHLAWTFSDRVWLWRPSDEGPLVLTGRNSPQAPAVNGTHLFWAEPGALYRRAHDTGEIVELAHCTVELPCDWVVVDEHLVTWGAYKGKRASLPTDAAPLASPTLTAAVGAGFVLAKGHYYWRENLAPPQIGRQLRRVPHGGRKPEVVLDIDGLPDLFLWHDRGTLYWFNTFCDGDEEFSNDVIDGRRCLQQYRLQ